MLALLVAAAGCGHSATSGDETGTLRALDAPAPPALESQLRSISEALEGVPDTPENAAKRNALLGVVPAADSHPRAVAELPLPNGLTLRMYSWRTRDGTLCLWGAVGETLNDLEGGPVGPCIAHPPCRRVCLDQEQLDELGGGTIVLGAVDADGEVIRLREFRGRTTNRPVAAIPIPGFDEWHVFAAHLGKRSYAVAELYVGERRIGSQKSVEHDYETEECIERAMREQEDETKCF